MNGTGGLGEKQAANRLQKERKSWKQCCLQEPLLLRGAAQKNRRHRMRGLDLESKAAETSSREKAKMKANKEFGSLWRLSKYPQCLSRGDTAVSAEDLALELRRKKQWMERQRRPIPAMSHRIWDKHKDSPTSSISDQNIVSLDNLHQPRVLLEDRKEWWP